MCAEIRSLCLSVDSKNILVGTFGSEIYELTTKDIKLNIQSKFNAKNIIRGHYCPNKTQLNEVWGLAIFPNNSDTFATCSDDGTLRLWSVS
jgi:WD40 repeat protein